MGNIANRRILYQQFAEGVAEEVSVPAPWTEIDEAELVALRDGPIAICDTAYGWTLLFLCQLSLASPDQQSPKQTLISSWKLETMSNEGIILIDADDESITVTWPPISKVFASNPARYSLQLRPSTSATDNGIDSGASLMYTSLSNDSTSTTTKKKNLTGAGHCIWFRVNAATKSKTRVDK
jgi:hypothetical protein